MATGTHSLSFSKSISEWCKKVNVATMEVVHESSIRAVTEMQKIGPSTAYPGGMGGRNPVDTGWHTSHLAISLTSMPQIDPTSEPPEELVGLGLHTFKWDSEETFSQIRQAKPGDTIYAGYTAAYAAFLEYRTGASSLFVTLVAQRWQHIVQQTVAETKHKLRL